MTPADPATSVFWIALCAVAAPLLSGLVPRRLVPEVVLLLGLGVLAGPHALGLAETGEAVGLLAELGLGMLFLLAGYEIELDEVTGPGGRRALVTWLVSLAAAFAVIGLLGLTGAMQAETAVAIALTSTALGTLLPILRDGGQLGSPFGATLLNHGALGELGPVIAMTLLLSGRDVPSALVVLALFAVAALAVALPWTRLDRTTSRLLRHVRAGSRTTGQTTVRLTILLLVTLLVLASVFDLDAVLGAFAAGLILRRLVPEGDADLEHKLDGLAFGLLIPVFFVTSGMAIDPAAVAAAPLALAFFVLLILLVRGVPVYLATRWQRAPGSTERQFSRRDSLRLGLYGATGLPIIVAVTSAAVANGTMTSASASLLVAGGAVTVLLLPMTATLLDRGRGGLSPSASAAAGS